MLTVAIRGPLAAKMRELAESTSMSLAKLLGDMVLSYESEVQGGYEPGTCLARWREQTSGSEA
jgi:predicted transcriptional regulator